MARNARDFGYVIRPGGLVSEPTHIRVRNARSHNLRGVDVEVPRNSLVVFTGVSGSGKSSLVYDTLFKEGQRRFMASLSAYARQFLGQMERPQVDAVEGISPTLSIDQKTVNRSPRSTVGTVTEIYDHLRLMMARLGTPHCPTCGDEISRMGIPQVLDRLLADHEGEKAQILGPIVKERKGEYRREIEQLQADGWVRARIDGEVVRLDEAPALERYKKHTIEVVVDRLKVKPSERDRLYEALETAVRLGEGVVHVLVGERLRSFSLDRACPKHPDQALPEMEPRLFSFNAPQGACHVCNGLGELSGFEPELLLDLERCVPDAFLAFNKEGRLPFTRFDAGHLIEICTALGADVGVPVGQWPAAVVKKLMYGARGLRWTSVLEDARGRDERTRTFKGLVPMVETIWHYTKHKSLAPYRKVLPCPACDGTRLSAISRAVTFRGLGIHQLSRMTIAEGIAFFNDVRLVGDEQEIGQLLLSEIRGRLEFLGEVGLGYLSLDRTANTLSGGESQRIRLASQVGSGLQGVTYILDEPSIGLHPRDNKRLLASMRRLRDRGNSVLVVEHDVETILAADHVIDVGPGAGREGGYVVASGSPARVRKSKASLTAAYLRGDREIAVPASRRQGHGTSLVVRGATANTLQQITAVIPLGCLVVVTGVSGSGKSSLVFQTLEPAVRARLDNPAARLQACETVEGIEHIDKLIRINQKPIGRTPRSNPATYTGAMDILRNLFAATPEARARGYTKSRFSFNVKGGRCEDCEGAGVKTIEMQFLPNVEVPCETCGRRRFNAETLDVRFKGLTIADVLDLTIGEAQQIFANIPKLARILDTLVAVGLDYVSLGQPSTTLSGGEAQRIKLATELHRPSTGRTLYLLDEPTTGLHLHDVGKLLVALHKLVDAGNTVIVVEHHTDVIKCADHLIDLGPEGGEAGGQVVGVGTPETLAGMDSPTGEALREVFGAAPVVQEPARRPKRRRALPRSLRVEGARKHNLQGVDVEIPHGTFTVVSGVSGSGKTSLAFDTIFAEGQRRYVESLSTYARRFLGRLDRAPVDALTGLQPAIAIDQGTSRHNPRSTVATVTEVHDVLRLLYARIGDAHCPACDTRLEALSPSTVAARWREADPGTGWVVTQLPPESNPEERRELLQRDGWLRLLVPASTEEVRLEDAAAMALLEQGAWLVVDRLNPARGSLSRLAEAVSRAYALGGGGVAFRARRGDGWLRATEALVCPDHGVVLSELTPRHFSFNSRLGQCQRCEGLGTIRSVEPERVFVDLDAGLLDALDPRVLSVVSRSRRALATLVALVRDAGCELDTPVLAYPEGLRDQIVHGAGHELMVVWKKKWGKTERVMTESQRWLGLVHALSHTKSKLSWVSRDVRCPDCGGGRLAPASMAVRIEGKNLHALSCMTVEDALETIRSWSLGKEQHVVAARAREELEARLGFLCSVGLGYLSLDRAASTLSGGEAQRIRLASQLGSQLTGVTYVLDEPTIGLHPRDTDRLLDSLEGLRDLGNTLVVVEHDPDTLRRADRIVELGPAAGTWGGQVVCSGTPTEVEAHAESLTGGWLSGRITMPEKITRREPSGWMSLSRPRTNNLKMAEARVPLGVWTSVTGVSGSGKSSLVMDTLAPALQLALGQDASPGPHGGFQVEGLALADLKSVVCVDQSPLGRSPRSTPATYVGVMDKLRRLYAATPGARMRGWGPGRFSFNAKGGRCETCEGRGAILVEMHFLPDVWVECDACRGRRFNRQTLDVRFKGASIADVLGMRVDEALTLFDNQKNIRKHLQALVDVGLGYIRLGQPGTTLSGGEAQRVKLAAELVVRRGHRVYVFDEPTTGLHLQDISVLVTTLQALVDRGHTVITIEHHLDMIRQADWVMELGPEGGAGGGMIVAEGTPEALAKLATPTGQALG